MYTNVRTCRKHCATTIAVLVLTVAGVTPSAAQGRAPVGVPIRVVNNHIYVRMQANGRDMWFLLDSGAGQTLINLPTADSLGFQLGDTVRIGGAGPDVRPGARVRNGTVRLPEDTTVSVAPQMAFPMINLNASEGLPVSGILGNDFIRQRVMEIDYAASQIRLHDPRTFRYAGKGTRVRLRMRDNFPHVEAELMLADGGRVKADAIIDLGAANALSITKPLVDKNRLLQRTGPTIYRQAGLGAGGATMAHLGRLSALRIGAAEVVAPVVGMHGDSAGVYSHDKLFEVGIGGEVMRRYTVTLDYSRNEMILEANAFHDEPFEVDMSGASFRTHTDGILVVDVMVDGPAMVAGLRRNDIITAVDDRPALEYGIDALRKRFRRAGGDVELTVRRGSAEQVVRISVRRLV